MAKQTLPVDFQDDLLNVSMGEKRRYKMINNSDGTVSLEDVTVYDRIGSNFGAGQINATNQAVNESFDKNKLIRDLDTINALTEEGYAVDALSVKQITESLPKYNEETDALEIYLDGVLVGSIPCYFKTITFELNANSTGWKIAKTLTNLTPGTYTVTAFAKRTDSGEHNSGNAIHISTKVTTDIEQSEYVAENSAKEMSQTKTINISSTSDNIYIYIYNANSNYSFSGTVKLN